MQLIRALLLYVADAADAFMHLMAENIMPAAARAPSSRPQGDACALCVPPTVILDSKSI